jgi:hypothetical protein
MTTDVWIPRLYVLGQVAALVVTGILLGLGKDSAVTDVFCAAAGGLILTSGYTKLTQGKSAPKTD